jgi:hypothetical protein
MTYAVSMDGRSRLSIRGLLLVVLGVVLGHFGPRALGQCQRAKLVAGDGEGGDKLGFSLAVCGQVAVIGAPFDDDQGSNSGAAYIFERSAGDWALSVKLTPEAGQPGDGFGRAVGISGMTAAAASLARHAVDVFDRSGAGAWQVVGQLTPENSAESDFFGWSVSMVRDLAIVGAPHDDDNGWRSGSAYMFERDPNGVWFQGAKLLADDGGAYDNFGSAVAIEGDVAVIGAPDDNDLGDWSGSAYVFERDPNGVWSQAAKLLPHDGSSFWNFGTSVAVGADSLLIGADGAHGAQPYTGAAYVFGRDPNDGSWRQTAKLTPDDGQTSDAFGRSVALDSDVALIGAPWDHAYTSGSAYVFVRGRNAEWSQVGRLVPQDGAYDDLFGCAIDLSGKTAVIGAYKDDDHGDESGSAYVFAVGPDEDGDGIMDVCLCPGDLDHDLDVDLADLAQLLSNYSQTSGMVYEDGDLDEDGDVDLTDLAALLAEYGTICP